MSQTSLAPAASLFRRIESSGLSVYGMPKRFCAFAGTMDH